MDDRFDIIHYHLPGHLTGVLEGVLVPDQHGRPPAHAEEPRYRLRHVPTYLNKYSLLRTGWGVFGVALQDPGVPQRKV